MFDAHVHIQKQETARDAFLGRLDEAGVTDAIVLSLPPPGFFRALPPLPAPVRLEHLLGWCAGGRLHPFFWLDPLADDAPAQIEAAVAAGVEGFKVICDRFLASAPAALAVWRQIAEAGKPILFHSGILWDGKVSSKFNRPIEFECLIEVPRLRFALAHVGWPWCDEALALYGKFLNASALDPQVSAEMYLDLTPGTPPLYREEVLRKLWLTGYDIEHNLLWGSDSIANDYNLEWVAEWCERDRRLLNELGADEAQLAACFGGNARRFLGLDPTPVRRRPPLQGQ